MNSIHNNGENDKSLNDDLNKLSNVYDQLEHDEPPELLDQAILNSAHRAVEKKPHWMQFGWLHGLTTTAVFVLAFTIILNQREPAPVYENGMRDKEVTNLQLEKSAKKQSIGQARTNELRMEQKVKAETRQDMQKSMPVATAPVSAASENAPVDSVISEDLQPMLARDSLRGKTEGFDKDAPARELMLEEELMDETDLMAAPPEAGEAFKVSRPATVAEPVIYEQKERARTDAEAEQILLTIIKLKQSGDASWKTELESFKETYPDYPLPDELTH